MLRRRGCLASAQRRGDCPATAFRKSNHLEDGLGVIEDGRLSDLLDVVCEEGLGTCAKGAVGGAFGPDLPAGPFVSHPMP